MLRSFVFICICHKIIKFSLNYIPLSKKRALLSLLKSKHQLPIVFVQHSYELPCFAVYSYFSRSTSIHILIKHTYLLVFSLKSSKLYSVNPQHLHNFSFTLSVGYSLLRTHFCTRPIQCWLQLTTKTLTPSIHVDKFY